MESCRNGLQWVCLQSMCKHLIWIIGVCQSRLRVYEIPTQDMDQKFVTSSLNIWIKGMFSSCLKIQVKAVKFPPVWGEEPRHWTQSHTAHILVAARLPRDSDTSSFRGETLIPTPITSIPGYQRPGDTDFLAHLGTPIPSGSHLYLKQSPGA